MEPDGRLWELGMTETGWSIDKFLAEWAESEFPGQELTEFELVQDVDKVVFFGSSHSGKVPSSVGRLTALVRFELDQSWVVALPEEVGNWTNLRWFKAFESPLLGLPEAIGNWADLEEMRINHSRLEFLPASIGNLTNLRVLNLGENSLMRLPEEIGNLAALESLELSGNRLGGKFGEPLPDSLGWLGNLRSLSLSSNHLTHLPESIARLDLEVLQLDYNHLGDLLWPSEAMENLRHLSLRGNRLTAVPKFVSGCARLEKLDVSLNSISEIPDEIVNLPQLRELIR